MINILVIDDQPYLQELISQELQDDGYTVESLTDAESVKGYLGKSEPDLVLLDLYLNGFEGWDLLDAIKNKYPHLPVLIVTAYDNYAGDPRLSKADGYILKDFHVIKELRKKISDLLVGRPGSHSSAFHREAEETGEKLMGSRKLGIVGTSTS